MRKITLLISLLLVVLLISPAAASQNKKVSTKSSDVIRFAFLTDLHISDVATNIEDLRLSVADMNAAAAAGSEDAVDFVIFGGDITEFGSDDEIALAYSIISQLKMPWYIVGVTMILSGVRVGVIPLKRCLGMSFLILRRAGFGLLGRILGLT